MHGIVERLVMESRQSAVQDVNRRVVNGQSWAEETTLQASILCQTPARNLKRFLYKTSFLRMMTTTAFKFWRMTVTE